ncbi:MAG: cytochrome c [Dongiaceae bacterium]
MSRRILIGLVAVLVIAAGGFVALAWRAAIAPITPPAASSFAPDLIARGEVLAGAGYCGTCHTAKGGKPYAGGYAMATGFGTIYSTNITPDPLTGIGSYSEAAFRRALHEGVARDGSHLFPAFPYDHFTKLTDDDVAALYAFMMTRAPVTASTPANTLPFPLNIRAFQAGWKLLFFRPGRFQADPARDPVWTRGAYLAEGISHCGACHTPRNLLGAEESRHPYAGAAIDNWLAPPLTQASPVPAPWTREEFFAYLRSGVSRFHGTAAGPMSPVIHDGLVKLPDADIQALAVYFADLGPAATGGTAAQPATLQSTAPQAAAQPAAAQPAAIAPALAADRLGVGQQYDPAARLYTAACASCHYNSGDTVNPLRPDLALNSAVSLDEPTNLIRVILSGIGAKEGAPGIVMPGFGHGFNDADIARIAGYIRATRTKEAPWPDLEKKVAAIRAQTNEQASQQASQQE